MLGRLSKNILKYLPRKGDMSSSWNDAKNPVMTESDPWPETRRRPLPSNVSFYNVLFLIRMDRKFVNGPRVFQSGFLVRNIYWRDIMKCEILSQDVLLQYFFGGIFCSRKF